MLGCAGCLVIGDCFVWYLVVFLGVVFGELFGGFDTYYATDLLGLVRYVGFGFCIVRFC